MAKVTLAKKEECDEVHLIVHCCCTPLIQSRLELASISSACNNIKLTCNKVCVLTF